MAGGSRLSIGSAPAPPKTRTNSSEDQSMRIQGYGQNRFTPGAVMERKCLADVKIGMSLYDDIEDVRYLDGWYRETIPYKF
jgi:hypothetical protein